jgi:hypothetical protein
MTMQRIFYETNRWSKSPLVLLPFAASFDGGRETEMWQ